MLLYYLNALLLYSLVTIYYLYLLPLLVIILLDNIFNLLYTLIVTFYA